MTMTLLCAAGVNITERNVKLVESPLQGTTTLGEVTYYVKDATRTLKSAIRVVTRSFDHTGCLKINTKSAALVMQREQSMK